MHKYKSNWLAYERVCKRFAEECAQRAEDGDLIWIRGINLMMVGWFLKDIIQVNIHMCIHYFFIHFLKKTQIKNQK